MILKYKCFLFLLLLLCFVSPVHAKSVRGHLIESGKELVNVVVSPVKGLVYTGPRNIKNAYTYEVYGREKEEKRGRFRYKMFAIWRAPGEELKATVSGITEGVTSLGKALNEVASVIFSD